MYKIYFADKVIIFDNNTEKYNQGTAILSFEREGIPCEKEAILKMLEPLKRLVVVAENPEEALSEFCSRFKRIKAAGGLVVNKEGNILMIFRFNRWDLPKGKLEPGEAIEHCSTREVSEETGINGLVRGKYLCDTFHMYQLKGEWIVKTTSWYAMSYAGDEPLKPQTEEGITGIEWVPVEKLDKYLHTSYSTTKDVFESAGYMIR